MKYQSEIINEIIDKEGHTTSLLHYESECIETWIEEVKGGYPKLCDYEGEWLNYIVENHIGEFPYVTITNVTDTTVNNVVPYAYKSAILKGSTKYRDIDTGEILESFEEGRNLELVSVKMPVLTTTNCLNLFTKDNTLGDGTNDVFGDFVEAKKNDKFSFNEKYGYATWTSLAIYNVNKERIYYKYEDNTLIPKTIVLPDDDRIAYVRPRVANNKIDTIIFNRGEVIPYEEYKANKTNILTVNEDVTLRSNGNICDELNLLTGQLTQRIDEDGEVLSQEVVKTVDLSVVNQDGETLSQIKPIEGTMHLSTSSDTIQPTFSGEIPVEAITQNLASFIEE